MMIRTMTIVGALAAMALVGCNRSPSDQAANARQDLQETKSNAQEDLASAKQNAAENVNDAQKNLAETQQDAQKNVNQTAQAAKQDIQEQRQDLNQAKSKEAATGGSGEVLASQSGTVLGTLTDMDKKSLTIKDSAGNEVELQRSGTTTVTQDGRSIAADQLHKGSEVRASYKVDEHGDKWAESVTLQAAPTDNTMPPSSR